MRTLPILMILFSSIGLFGGGRSLILKFESEHQFNNVSGNFHIIDHEQIPGKPVFRVEVDSTLGDDALVSEFYAIEGIISAEKNQKSHVIGATAAAIIDARPIMVLDARPIMVLDARPIMVLDDSERSMLANNEFANDPLFGQSFFNQIGAYEAIGHSTGAGVTVAVLDTGVDMDHPFLAGNLSPYGHDFVDEDPIADEERTGLDSNENGQFDEGWGHGTHIAGIIAMIAPNANILPVRVIDGDGSGDLFDILQGLEYAVDQGAKVINMSLSIPEPSSLLTEWIYELRKKKVLVVTSAGNKGSTDLLFPSNEASTITVGSVNSFDQLSAFSNYGANLDVVAPGENVLSCHPGDGTFIERSGTSISAPMAAAQAALILEHKPNINYHALRDRIRNTSRDVDAHNSGYEGLVGKGVINLPDSLGIK